MPFITVLFINTGTVQNIHTPLPVHTCTDMRVPLPRPSVGTARWLTNSIVLNGTECNWEAWGAMGALIVLNGTECNW